MGNEKDTPPLYLMKIILEMKILRSTFARTCFFMTIIGIQGYNCIGLYWMTKMGVFHQYITYVLLTQTGILGLMVTLSFTAGIALPQPEDLWDMRSVSSEAKRYIISQCRMVSSVCFILLILVVIVYLIAVLPLFGDEKDIIHYLAVAQYYHEMLFEEFMVLFYFSIAVTGFCQGYNVLFAVYLIMMANIQLYFLNDQLLRICSDASVGSRNEFVWEEDYQNVIYRRIVVCVENHIKLKRYLQSVQDLLKLPVMYVPLSSLCPVGAVYFVLTDISPKSNIRMVLILAMFLIIVATLTTTGQYLENLSEEMFIIVGQNPWVYWNKKNRQAMLIVLLNCTKNLSLQGYISMSLNVGILLRFQKWIYTLITVLY